MKLNLKNPLVFFDLETTGTNINTDRIVEICYLKVYPNGNEESKTMRVNPEMHIPEASTAIHGIHDEDVADCPTFTLPNVNLLMYRLFITSWNSALYQQHINFIAERIWKMPIPLKQTHVQLMRC